MAKRALTWVWRGVIGLAVAYVLLLCVGYAFQRHLLYKPPPAVAQPSISGAAIQVAPITTADGEHLVGWYLPPQAGKPVILFFGSRSSSLAGQEGRWRRMADAGVGFLAIGYRGYSGSTGKPSEKGLHADARAAYDWLAKRYPASDIIIHGYSLGSGVAVRLAAEHPARALILEAPYTSMDDFVATKVRWAPIKLMMKDKYLSAEWIAKVHTPLLIVHGDNDTVIPFAQGQRMFKLANGPKTFVHMMGSDHYDLTGNGLYDHIWKFLGIPAGPTVAANQMARFEVMSRS